MAANDTDNDRLMEAYYADMRNTSYVSPQEEQLLVKAYHSCVSCSRPYPLGSSALKCATCGVPRNLKARDKLISGVLRFVVKVAKEYAYRTKGPNFESDFLAALVSAGNIGLLVAADRFDLSKNTRFITYAAWWVREKILEELDSQGVVRVPAHKQKALRSQRKHGGGTQVEAPHVTLVAVDAIDESGQSDTRLERDLMNTYGMNVLRQALTQLDLRERDKYIVLAYFGAREEPKNLRQISSRLDLSSERVRQIKKNTMEQLRDFLQNKRVEGLHDVYAE